MLLEVKDTNNNVRYISGSDVNKNEGVGLDVVISPYASFGTGHKAVNTAGTQVALAASTACKKVTIKALALNTKLIYVGISTVSSLDGFELTKQEEITIYTDNLANIWIDSAVNGEGVSYIYEN